MTVPVVPAAASVRPVDPATTARWLERGEAILVDVREPFEHASAHIASAKLIPLTGFQPQKVEPTNGKKLVVHCKAGTRAQQAAAMLIAAGRQEVYCMTGGIEAWKAAGLPVSGTGRRTLDPQRQVFIIVACMILTGLGLGAWVSPWWLILAAIPGLGLLNAGLTGFCPLLYLVAAAPWNRAGPSCPR